MNIEKYLATRPDLEPIDILIPENCALCTKGDKTIHVVIEGDEVIEMEVKTDE